jgi:phage/plasmid-like protein (TIGR03299 family)
MTRINPYTIIGKTNEREVTSAHELMEATELDWTVSLEPAYVLTTEGKAMIPNRYGTMRTKLDGTHDVLGVVGSNYKVFQNSEIFSCLDEVVGMGDARYGAAGELKGGNVVWTVLELPNNITVGDDKHSGYIIARTSHDGSTPFQMTPSVIRLGCTNQINAAMASGRESGIYYSVRHSTNSKIDREQVKYAFKMMNNDITKYVSISTMLRSITMADSEFVNYTKRVYPLPSKIEFSPYELLSAGEKTTKTRAITNRLNAIKVWSGTTGTQDNIAGTKFGAFQAIVEATDHFSKDYEKQAGKMILGTDLKVKSRALELLGV